VRGITPSFRTHAALIEIAHWYENVFLLGWSICSLLRCRFGRVMSLLVFVFVILVDNVFARLKWQTAIRSAWVVRPCSVWQHLALSLCLPNRPFHRPAAGAVAKPPPARHPAADATPV